MNKITETAIPQNFSSGIYNDMSYDLSSSFVPAVADIIFTSIAQALGDMKKKDTPVAFIVKKANDDFIAGAVIRYIPNEDDNTKPGSWNYSWTWYKDDIPSNALLKDLSNPEIYTFYRLVGQGKYSAAFRSQVAIIDLTRYFLETLSKWLDDNASETEEVGVEMEGVFEASVSVEDGVIVKSLVPKGEIKELIKDDSKLEID